MDWVIGSVTIENKYEEEKEHVLSLESCFSNSPSPILKMFLSCCIFLKLLPAAILHIDYIHMPQDAKHLDLEMTTPASSQFCRRRKWIAFLCIRPFALHIDRG